MCEQINYLMSEGSAKEVASECGEQRIFFGGEFVVNFPGAWISFHYYDSGLGDGLGEVR